MVPWASSCVPNRSGRTVAGWRATDLTDVAKDGPPSYLIRRATLRADSAVERRGRSPGTRRSHPQTRSASGARSHGPEQLELAERLRGRARSSRSARIGSTVRATPTSRGEFIASRSCSASVRPRERRVDSLRGPRGCRYPAADRVAGVQRAGGHGSRGRSAPRTPTRTARMGRL